ncbi:DNA-binding transcriptional LysR family regulator [Silvimonas terrae]|uniref:DNA-binding transcriptional LysR family regulator n=1 Tax=Silvimonas terrae TaxID=300266 RepID=A0A840RCV5_9NEIS|nr:LysR family transcriptional regulator [Silvimonas terrae]MBB5191175.1 DNA-binding transcriptional LysR family regulator [Silvimonas terrae]
MDSLGSLSAFVQAADTRSFTAAGRKLGVSSSAIGKAITRLEDKLGVRLFHRSTRAITLTPEGACFLERCRRIFSEIEAAEQELMHSQEAPRGTLRISLPLAGMLMMPTLSAFMQHYPEIALEIDFSDRLVEVIEEGFDAVIRAGELSDSRLMSRVLGTFELLLVASPAYLARQGLPATPADLQAHVCLHHRFATSGKLEPWPLAQPELPVSAVVNTIEPLIYMAEQGLGIACLPDFSIRPQLAQGRLVQVLAAHTRHSGTFRLLWPSSRHLSPKLRVFVDYMSAHLFARHPQDAA